MPITGWMFRELPFNPGVIPVQNITIGRYKPAPTHPPFDGANVVDIADHFAGWIEGIRDDGSSWIMYLDAAGSPLCFWAHREPDGAAIGDAIDLV
ncbi:hypothetical protein [Nocardia sp. NPDC004260]